MILRGHIFSQVLEMDTGLTIVAADKFLPHGSHKVVYLLHGLCGNSESWADYTMLPAYADKYDAVFILPEGGRSFYRDMRYGQRVFSYIARELPQICQGLLHISSRREDTVIIGGSMGGYGALQCALSYPEQYGTCCALSSACLFMAEAMAFGRQNPQWLEEQWGRQLGQDFNAIFGPELQPQPEDELLFLAQKIDAAGPKPRLYAACGKEDPFLGDHRRFQQQMAKLNFDFTYEELPGAHDWIYFDRALQRALHFAFKTERKPTAR